MKGGEPGKDCLGHPSGTHCGVLGLPGIVLDLSSLTLQGHFAASVGFKQLLMPYEPHRPFSPSSGFPSSHRHPVPSLSVEERGKV